MNLTLKNLNGDRILKVDFYERDTAVVARHLIGKVLVRRDGETAIAGIISETEAYYGQDDPASHAYRGKTKRSEIMFLRPGIAYVYFCYGVHYMLNAVTEKTGTAGAVLVRSVIPVAGINLMMINRNISSDSGNLPFSKDKIISESLKLYRIIASGPGRLTQAFNITGRNNGLDLTDFNSGLYILNSRGTEQVFENNNVTVIKSPRIGVSSGKDMHLRFFIDVKKFLNIKEEK